MILPLDLLKTYLAVADAGSFTKAGQRVHLTQSAVSMQMKRLEEEVGRPLFAKQGRSYGLTSAGEALIEHALRIVKAHDEAVSDLACPDLYGRIRFGCPEDYVSQFLTDLLYRFRTAQPRVQVEIQSAPSEDLKAALDRGELDLALCVEIIDGGQIVHREPVVWAASVQTAVYEERPLPLALYHQGCIYRKWALDSLQKSGMDYWIAFISPSMSGILAAVRAGLAVAPVGVNHMLADVQTLGPEKGFPLLPVANIALHRSNGHPTAAVESFAQHVNESFRKLNTYARPKKAV